MNTHVVIMAGGIGSRFWPMSTQSLPKQFVDVMGVGRTMIQQTFDRSLPLCPAENMWVVTGEAYVDLVKAQVPEIPYDHIIAEPAARSTAPCIALACWKIRCHYPDANIVVTPSDALVLDPQEYRRVLSKALEYTAAHPDIVTVGICPNRPETGYGYIKEGEHVGNGVHKVQSFREKPSLDVAKAYLDEGGYLWNAGIFVWNVSTIVDSMRMFVPELAAKMDLMSESFYTPSEAQAVADIFPACEKISIDYAVMEKADYIFTIPGSFGWSDVGTWGSLWTLLPHDQDGNAVIGENVHLYDCKGCIVHAPKASSVVLEGLEDCIVVERDGRVLICSLKEEQRIKDFAK
jgi:mannose-1-phosphate guanylyltransferase